MEAPNLLLKMMLSLQTKAEAYRTAFPLGSVLDPQSPVYVDMLQSLKAANAAIDKIDAGLDAQAKDLIVTLTKQKEDAEAQAVKLAAQEAAEQKQRADRVKAAMDKVGQTRLPTLPFEEAYSPKAARLQHLITRFSQIGSAIHSPGAQH